MKYNVWAYLVLLLLVACQAPAELPAEPVEVASPTIHPLFADRDTTPRAEPRATSTRSPTRTPTPIGFQTEAEMTATAQAELESESVNPDTVAEEPTEAVAMVEEPEVVVEARRECATSDELADVMPPAYVLPGPWPKPDASLEVLRNVATSNLILNLGFDVEGDPTPVPALLEVLDSHGIYTNFFILGSWAEENPALVSMIADAGHEIGNHSYSHERMGEWAAEDILADLEQAENILLQIAGIQTRPWLRPPFGNHTDASVAVTTEAGWTTVLWANGSNDFVEGTPEEVQNSICADLLEGAESGAVLISHTFNGQTPMAVDRFVREMHRDGYVFAPLSVLVSDSPESFLIVDQP